jgi:hypothetical protein
MHGGLLFNKNSKEKHFQKKKWNIFLKFRCVNCSVQKEIEEEGIIARKYYEVIYTISWQARVFVNACYEGIRKKILTNFWDHFLCEAAST